MKPDTQVNLSVVIPAWNEAATLEETISRISEALRTNDAPGFKWEILVCDNNSTDDTAKIAEQAGARVVFESQRGIACARNAGAKAARGEWLLFIDADTYPSPELMSELCEWLKKGGIVGCGAEMKPFGGKWWMRMKIRRDNILLRLLGLSPGVFICCQREAFQAIGGFNPDLAAGEELGFVHRLRRYGSDRGLAYPIIRQHRVATSARTKGGMLKMGVSYIVGIFIFVANALLPKRLQIRSGWKHMSFWYGPRN